MRADAKRNYDRLLAVADEVIAEQGADASLREIARRADVGMGTMHRHFATREALLEALLRSRLATLTQAAITLAEGDHPGDGLISWFRDGVTFVQSYSGVVDLLADALADANSALHASCTGLRSAGTRLLARAQEVGAVRCDLDGTDLFALMGALGWINDQPSFSPRGDRLTNLIASALGSPATTRL